MKEIRKSKLAVEALHGLQQTWLAAMSSLAWHTGESDADYKARVAKPYDEFSQRIEKVRTSLTESETKVAKKDAKAKPAHATKAAAAKTSATKAKKH